MNTVAISVRSGLCNRLRVVLWGIAFAEMTKRRLAIHWPREDPAEKGGGGIFEASLRDLFDHPFNEITQQQFMAIGAQVKQKAFRMDVPGDLHIQTINMLPGFEPADDFPQKQQSHQWLADRSVYQKSFAEYFSVMKPSADVHELINVGATLISGHNCVAVMPRLCLRKSWPDSDPEHLGPPLISYDHNFESGTRSPPEKFIARMKLFPPETVFFLVADCLEVEQLMRAEFGSRIIQLPQTYKYNRETIIKRTAELYIAAKCNRILGAYISSFAEFAGWLAGGMYSGCYQWSASDGEKYECMGKWEPTP